MASESYVCEKLYQAVDSLATSLSPIRERLYGAYIYLTRLKPDDFIDEHSRLAFTGIMDTLTARDAKANEGRVRATLEAMSDEQAQAVAKEIYELDGHYRPLWYFVGRSILDTTPPDSSKE